MRGPGAVIGLLAGGGALSALGLPLMAVAAIAMVVGGNAASQTAGGDGLSCQASAFGQSRIPARFMPDYQAAAQRFGLGARGVFVLASVHQVETSFGEGGEISSKNALGPMQFLPTTWIKGAAQYSTNVVVRPTLAQGQGYATDGDGDGLADINNVHDAIHAAARYLRASGAPNDFPRALLAYNHDGSYVKKVLDGADALQGPCTVASLSGPVRTLGELDFNDTSGEWGGSMKFALALLQIGVAHGCGSSSEKRPRQLTADGGVSDHWTGSTSAYAVDIGRCSLAFPGGPLDQTAQEIAQALEIPERTGVHNVIHGHYRFQLLWQTYEGGNHYNHVHIGVKRLAVTP